MQALSSLFGLVMTLTPTATWQVVSHPIAMPVYAQEAPTSPTESLEALANKIALEHGIATTTLSNMAYSESRWQTNIINADGDTGIVQINPKYWPVSTEQALDPEFALNFAADQIKLNGGVHWTSCNCVAYLRVKGVHFPRLNDAKDLDSNSSIPVKGGAVKLVYNGVYHLAYVESVEDDGIHISEANYHPCLIAPRILSFNDPHIVGFYTDKI